MNALRSALVWSVTWLYMTLAGLICLPGLWLTGRLDQTYAMARRGLRLLLWMAGVQVEVDGREYLQPGSAIYMVNHQSNLDPPVLLATLPGQIAFLAKKELFGVPILGTVLRLGQLVPIDRGDRAAAQAAITRAAATAHAGRPFLVFPEGTRTRDGSLLPFKKGPFYLAQQAAVPVIPVAVAGTGALMPPGSWRIRPGRVRLRVHAPITADRWNEDPDPRSTLADLVRACLESSVRA